MQRPISPSMYTILVFSLVYSWLIVGWFVVRRAYLRWSERSNHSVSWHYYQNRRNMHSRVLGQYVIGAVFALAVLCSPLAFLMVEPWFTDPRVTTLGIILTTALVEIILGLLIAFTMILAMPVLYDDMEVDFPAALKLLNPFSWFG